MRKWLLSGVVLAATALAWPPLSPADTRQQRLAQQLSASMRLAGGGSGAWVMDTDSGKTLFTESADRTRTPASVQKLFTTAAVLDRFGERARLRTTVSGDGELRDGTLTGNLHVKGFGDPSLSSYGYARRFQNGLGSRLAALAAGVRAAGVQVVTGRIYGDDTYFDLRRGVPASGFRVSHFVGPLSALAFNRGTLDERGRGFQQDPPRFVAERLSDSLRARGVAVEHAARAGRAPADSWPVAAVSSPAMSELVWHTNHTSDNYFAELLLKGLGARFGESGSTAAGAAVVRRFEGGLGLASRVVDGSGLSRANAVSPRAVGRLLWQVESKPWFPSFYRSLALAGRSGTLRDRMRGTPAAGRCRAKTGTLVGVSGLAGYCRSGRNQRIAFAVLMNRVNVSTARRAQNRVAALIAGYRG